MNGRLYSRALRDGLPLEAVYPDGRRVTVPVHDWCGPLRPGDGGLLDRCTGATLDIGCGPGRIVAALRRRGIPALGIDVSEDALRRARVRGARVLRCSVFGEVPRPGGWDTAVLADGSIGIGGVPVALLRRVAGLLAPAGTALVEVDGPGARSVRTEVRLASGGRVSRPFPWASLALRDAAMVASLAGLVLEAAWWEADRWFVALGRP